MHFCCSVQAAIVCGMNTAKMTDDLIKHGMTQATIAAACGVSQSTVSRWRKGIDPEGPSRDKLAQLYAQTFTLELASLPELVSDAALHSRLLQVFDRIRDPRLKNIAIRQIEALADQQSEVPPEAPDDLSA